MKSNELNMKNDLYHITVKNDPDLEDKFAENMSQFLDADDADAITGSDFCDKSIYLTFIDKYKVLKLIEFFKKYNLLVDFGKVDNIIDFIHNDKNFFDLYSDEYNNILLNNYIMNNITRDNILERISSHSMEYLLPIELEILKKQV